MKKLKSFVKNSRTENNSVYFFLLEIMVVLAFGIISIGFVGYSVLRSSSSLNKAAIEKYSTDTRTTTAANNAPTPEVTDETGDEIASGVNEPDVQSVTDSRDTTDVKSASTSVQVFIGESRFTIFGYTSPYAKVELDGQGIFDSVEADENGYFIFENNFSPLSPREVCLTAIDTDGRLSTPECLPPFPVHKRVVIGPVILPPTISTNAGALAIGDFGILSGKGAPASQVSMNLSADASAKPLNISTQTDHNGNYTLTLPTDQDTEINVHSTNAIQELRSPKSNTLHVEVLPPWKLLLRALIQNVRSYLPFLLPALLLIEAGLLIWYFLHKEGATRYPLALRPEHDPIDPHHGSN